jgi:hypothetical protein
MDMTQIETMQVLLALAILLIAFGVASYLKRQVH